MPTESAHEPAQESAVSRGRGRPRSEKARQAILDAACDLLLEGGVAAASMEAIAARAGVSKTTIYKWWQTRGQVLLESFFERTKGTIERDPADAPEAALTKQLGNLIELVRDETFGGLLRELIAIAQADSQIREALTNQWIVPRRAVAIGILQDAVSAGELRPDIDLLLCSDQLFAPVYYRLLLGHAPLSSALARDTVAQLMHGLRVDVQPHPVVE